MNDQFFFIVIILVRNHGNNVLLVTMTTLRLDQNVFVHFIACFRWIIFAEFQVIWLKRSGDIFLQPFLLFHVAMPTCPSSEVEFPKKYLFSYCFITYFVPSIAFSYMKKSSQDFALVIKSVYLGEQPP